MSRFAIVVLLLLAFVVSGSFSATGQTPAEKKKSVFDALKVGQSVMIKDVDGRYEISTLEGVPGDQGYKIREIGPDHLVVEDIAGVAETYIPIYSIKAIVRLKLAPK